MLAMHSMVIIKLILSCCKWVLLECTTVTDGWIKKLYFFKRNSAEWYHVCSINKVYMT